MTASREKPETIVPVTVALAEDSVTLDWSDGQRLALHPDNLRHSPGYPGGRRPAGPGGRFPLAAAELAPVRATLADDGALCLVWGPGDVESRHALEWLRQRLGVARQLGAPPPRLATWDAASIVELPEPCFADVQADPDMRMALFEQVLNRGVARLRAVSGEPGIVESVGAWFGRLQENPYADDCARPALASIRVDASTPVATRQSHFLGPHTDTCWRQGLAGLLLMHCLEAHPDGGRSMLVDGFAVAERLREEAPDAFELLATVPVNFAAVVSEQDEWRALGRILSVAPDGVIEGVRYNGNSIDQLECPAHLVGSMYAALGRFERILFDRDLWWQPKLAAGDLLVIDNHRVLHGREAFDPAAGERHLQCCSVERDDFHNRYRRLARERGVADWSRRLSAGVF